VTDDVNYFILIFTTGLHSSLILFIGTYTVSYRDALDRLRVRLYIILFVITE